MGNAEKYQHGRESIERAQSGASIGNDLAVIMEFSAKGIPESEITPRVNVFTFWGWKALGRSVRKGEHGVHLTTWIRKEDKELPGKFHVYPKAAVVFHISQTDVVAS